MQSLRQMGAGVLLGIVSIVVVLGGFSLAMAESGLAPAVVPTASPTTSAPASIIVTIYPTLPLPISASATPQPFSPDSTNTPGPTLSATASLTLPPTSMTCRPPTGWVPIVVQPYDTLASLSLVYRTSVDVLRTKNCLLSDQLVAGSILYVPPLPTSTFIPCGAPANWGYYTVVPGDTLYHISMLYRVTVSQLMQANCLYTSNISAGQVLRVPNVPTSTPAVRDTPIPTWTASSTLTPSQPAPTTGVPTATQTPSATTVTPATDTATSPATETNIPTDTAAPTDTSVPTNAPLPTDTPTPPTPAASA